MSEGDDDTAPVPAPSEDVEMTAEFARDALTPVVRVCRDCAGESIILGDDIPAPATPVAAWALVTCRGTGDWWWCRTNGTVTMRRSFDRRKEPR